MFCYLYRKQLESFRAYVGGGVWFGTFRHGGMVHKSACIGIDAHRKWFVGRMTVAGVTVNDAQSNGTFCYAKGDGIHG